MYQYAFGFTLTEKNMSARTFCYALQRMTLHFMFSDGDTLRNS